MKENLIKLLMFIYLKIVNVFRGKIKKPSKHLDKFKLPIDEFNDLINTYEYKMDPLGGLIDIVGPPDEFFEEKETNRDCDNFANVICVNGVLNGYRANEYVITDPTNIKTIFNKMHVICVLDKDGEYILGNYKLYKGFKSTEEALDYMKNFPSYKDKRLVVHSREIKLA